MIKRRIKSKWGEKYKDKKINKVWEVGKEEKKKKVRNYRNIEKYGKKKDNIKFNNIRVDIIIIQILMKINIKKI